MRRVTAVIAAGLALAGCSAELRDDGAAAGFTTCAAFTTQPAAQQAWERAGRPARSDGDGDGKVCEALRQSTGGARSTGCEHRSGVFDLGFSATKYPHIMRHTRRAIAHGQPSVLVLNRAGADTRRDRLLADIPTKPDSDRDEYPPAVARATWKADVMYVPSAENRSHGSVMGLKLRRFCDGVKFRYIFY